MVSIATNNLGITRVQWLNARACKQPSAAIIPSMQWIVCIASCKICRLAIAQCVSTGLRIATKYYNDSSA